MPSTLELVVSHWSTQVSTSPEILTALCVIANYDYALAQVLHYMPSPMTISTVASIVTNEGALSVEEFDWEGCSQWQSLCDQAYATWKEEQQCYEDGLV